MTMRHRTTSARPNILLILADDLGFSDLGCYGSEIATPSLDALAAEGVRFTQFYNTARCSPSRASLLTGLHPHQTGIGILTGDNRPVGYRGSLNGAGATAAEIFHEHGYRTAAIGKWHLSSNVWEVDDAWPTRRGFGYFYGSMAGCGSYYSPETLVRGESRIPEEAAGEGYYYTTALSQEAAQYVAEATAHPEPFFLYLAYTAPHWPLHAPDHLVRDYQGCFDDGWDVLRQRRLERQKELGLVAEDVALSPRDPDEPAWSSLTPAEQAWYARRMEVYAAQITEMDRGVGLVLDTLREAGELDNTIVVFLSDNGASPEELPHIPNFVTRREYFTPTTRDGAEVRYGNYPDIMPGPPETYGSYGRPWANLSNTPFRLYKKWVHEGGIAAPFILRWPGITELRPFFRAPAQLVHVLPTLLEAAGIDYHGELAGERYTEPAGASILPELSGSTSTRPGDPLLYWEHCGNAAVRDGDRKLVRRYPGPWELYDLGSDPTELHDILAENRDEAERLLAAWTRWADGVGVRPYEPIVQLHQLRGDPPTEAAR